MNYLPFYCFVFLHVEEGGHVTDGWSENCIFQKRGSIDFLKTIRTQIISTELIN